MLGVQNCNFLLDCKFNFTVYIVVQINFELFSVSIHCNVKDLP